jgi:hypothetical protein
VSLGRLAAQGLVSRQTAAAEAKTALQQQKSALLRKLAPAAAAARKAQNRDSYSADGDLDLSDEEQMSLFEAIQANKEKSEDLTRLGQQLDQILQRLSALL